MNVVQLWNAVCSLLKNDMSDVSFKTWVESAVKPVEVKGNHLVLEIASEFNRKNLQSRYGMLLENAVSAAAGQDMVVDLFTPNELAAQQPAPAEEGMRPVHFTQVNMFNPKSTFDTFVVGSSNRFAHAASLAVAEDPGNAYNPLFIYGGVGLGKTHLMHAIGHYIQDQFPNMRLLYLSSETFTNELITAIQTGKNNEFRNRFRNVDVLMVDDIQFIAGRESTQEEFFHTFNALHSAGKQIIISSDKPPKEIARLEERLRSRFEWGLIADIAKPDLDTRIAILRKKANSEGIHVDDDVLELIGTRIESNIRELEGSLTRVIAFASLTGRTIDLALAEEALRDILSVRDPKRITGEVIIKAVSNYYSVSVEDIKSQKRKREIALPRQVAMYLTRELTPLSLPAIGDVFGRDHTTVMHSYDKISELIQSSPDMGATIAELKKDITEK